MNIRATAIPVFGFAPDFLRGLDKYKVIRRLPRKYRHKLGALVRVIVRKNSHPCAKNCPRSPAVRIFPQSVRRAGAEII